MSFSIRKSCVSRLTVTRVSRAAHLLSCVFHNPDWAPSGSHRLTFGSRFVTCCYQRFILSERIAQFLIFDRVALSFALAYVWLSFFTEASCKSLSDRSPRNF